MYSPDGLTLETADTYVSDLCDKVCNCMKQAEMCAIEKFRSQTKREKSWWNKHCTWARDRCRLFHDIWSAMGRPKSGEAYQCYKASRKDYRRVCRKAVSTRINYRFKMIDKLFKENN